MWFTYHNPDEDIKSKGSWSKSTLPTLAIRTHPLNERQCRNDDNRWFLSLSLSYNTRYINYICHEEGKSKKNSITSVLRPALALSALLCRIRLHLLGIPQLVLGCLLKPWRPLLRRHLIPHLGGNRRDRLVGVHLANPGPLP